jgi:hypothetical protein
MLLELPDPEYLTFVLQRSQKPKSFNIVPLTENNFNSLVNTRTQPHQSPPRYHTVELGSFTRNM